MKHSQQPERDNRRSVQRMVGLLLEKLDAEIVEDESAMIYARNNGEWPRHAHLEGHRTGLLTAKGLVLEMQPNDKLNDPATKTL